VCLTTRCLAQHFTHGRARQCDKASERLRTCQTLAELALLFGKLSRAAVSNVAVFVNGPAWQAQAAKRHVCMTGTVVI
jgi:hypothetical protein